MFDVIAFDADDTLWHNEPIYRGAQRQVLDILAHYHDQEWIERRMYETEIRNLEHYGYGIKGFTLSMIETAIELTEGRISGDETLTKLAASHELMLITKGDLFEQQAKIARSGLSGHFGKIEIVPVKIRETYQSIVARHEISPDRFLMVGNSIRSDVLPVIEMGGRAVHIPYETTWEHEIVPEEELAGREFIRLAHIRELPALIYATTRPDWISTASGSERAPE